MVMPSKREARLTPSPITVYSMRCAEPMLPLTTLFVLRPMPMANVSVSAPNFFLRAALKISSAPSCSSEVLQLMHASILPACSVPGSETKGTPKQAMMASPMNLSRMPPLSKIRGSS